MELLKADYLHFCEQRGLAEETIMNRRAELDRFSNWLRRGKRPVIIEAVTGEDIIEYIKSRSAFRSKVTVYAVVSMLRGFGEYLLQEGAWMENPLRWIKGPHIDPRSKLPRGISKADQLRIWEEVCRFSNEYQRVLWILILSILYGIGIRRGELERLKVDDWDRYSGLLKIDGRKTGYERRIPLPETTWRSLESYLPHRHNLLESTNRVGEKTLLVTSWGTPLRGQQISKRLKRITKRAGVQHVTVHQFRHTCASDLLNEGIGISHIQHILGHRAIANTFRYAHVADPERKKAMARHPINKILSGINQGG